MNHKDRQDTFKRITGKNSSTGKVILFAEGRNTESSYFNLLGRANCKVIPITKKGKGISKCVDFVNDSLKAWTSMPEIERRKYAERWLVFDADGREDFAEGVKLARKLGFHVAYSNMCIEYWFMLHFYNHSGDPIPLIGNSHSEAQIREINRYIRAYNKKAELSVREYSIDNKKVEEDFFDLMLAIDPITHKRRIVSAYERAKKIYDNKKADGAQLRESVTNIFELLEKLGTIYKTANGYELYIV
jgi:hypothetical protein